MNTTATLDNTGFDRYSKYAATGDHRGATYSAIHTGKLGLDKGTTLYRGNRYGNQAQ